MAQGTSFESRVVGGWPPRSPDWGRDELVRLQFRCATLERRLENEGELRAAADALQSQVAYLAGELAAIRSERDRFASAMRSAAALNRSSLAQITAVDPEGLAADDRALAT